MTIYNNRYTTGYNTGYDKGISDESVQTNAAYNRGFSDGNATGINTGKGLIHYTGTLNSSGNGGGFSFAPVIGLTYGHGTYTYFFINKSITGGTIPSKGYLSYRYSTSSLMESDTSFSGSGNGYVNWNRSGLGGKTFHVWGI